MTTNTIKGITVGYVRVSSDDQNLARQLDGLTIDKLFSEKVMGADIERPQLEAMLAYVREGDTVIVHSMDRFARSMDDLRKLVYGLTERGISVKFHKEGLTFTGEKDALSNLMLSVLGAVGEFERNIINERRREGIAIAKRNGVYKGRQPSLSDEQVIELKRRATTTKKAQLAKDFKICRSTVYTYLSDKGMGLNHEPSNK
jgi:DNA invertase Pin-like site-specific DNA recombinase